MKVALLVMLALAACGSSTPSSSKVATPAPDAGPPPPLAEGCPATWAEITSQSACDLQSGCDYPEGSCWCGVAMPCSGAARDPEEFADVPSSWQCTAVPPAFRDDGCPGSQPTGACGQNGQRCTYGSCCVTEYVCERGQWKMGNAECPP
jgi:hypothetical protein